jgi:hypothetical protein
MADADINETTNAGAGRTREAKTTRTPPGEGPTVGADPGPQPGGDGGAGQTDGAARKATKREPVYYVDGQAVSRGEYLKAAEGVGWNPQLLAERNYYPAISTAK